MKPKRKPSKIGKLLIEEGYVTEADINRALEIQAEEAEAANVPLGIALVHKGFITKEQLKTLLEHPEIRKNIGTMVLEKGWCTKEQLDACLEKKKPGEPIGIVLMREGYISQNNLDHLLAAQLDGLKMGELAVKLNMIDEEDLKEVLKAKRPIRTIGEILCDMQLITPDDLNAMLLKMYSKNMRLGEILLKQKIINERKLEEALLEQSQKNQTLGKILVQKEFVTKKQLYSALSLQVNIPFETLNDFEFDNDNKTHLTRIIAPKYSQKHLILPLSLNGNYLRLAISTPESRGAVEELREVYPHLRINCVLIMEEKFIELFENLYGWPFNSATPVEENESPILISDETKQIVSDPQTDTFLIDQMFYRYLTLLKETNSTTPRPDASSFKEFIINSYHEICQQFDCKRVAYFIEPWKGNVEIFASPESSQKE